MAKDQTKSQDLPAQAAGSGNGPAARPGPAPPPLPAGRRAGGAEPAKVDAETLAQRLAEASKTLLTTSSPPAAGPPAPAGTAAAPVIPPPAPAPSSSAPSTVASGTTRPAKLILPSDDVADTGEPPDEALSDELPKLTRRRPAGPSRGRIAANDDAPSIGGLIYALNQKPSNRPFVIASIASGAWSVLTIGAGLLFFIPELTGGGSLSGLLVRPELLTLLATLFAPISLFWFLAMMAWRTEELRLRSNAMTEVAVRLAEPDRMAEQSVASLGQAVRRQVSFMNDAVARALGRAGELEALVHNEVTALERSYEDNERKIRRLINELAGERDALVNTSDRVSDTLQRVNGEVPQLIEALSSQQLKLAQIIDGAGQNLTALETAIAQQAGNLETTIGDRTQQLHVVLDHYTTGLDDALGSRTQVMEDMLGRNMEALGNTIAARTENLQLVFEEYARALDGTLSNRAQALDMQLVQRTKALDEAFSERLRLFDDSIARSTLAIDSTIGERTSALTGALEQHARSLSDTLGRQAVEMDESLMQGISAVRRTSESITRQSLKAIEGLAGQADLLKNVSENLLTQVNSVTNRFENQGTSIMRAANALETANHRIDQTLQSRQVDLSQTLDRLAGKADELGNMVQGYSARLEGSMTEAERRARSITSELAQGAEERSRATIADIERLRDAAAGDADRALEDLRSRFANVSREVSTSLGALTSQFGDTTTDMRQRAAEASSVLMSEQQRIRAQIENLPQATRESTEAMRRALQDQLRALEQLSTLTNREGQSRDISRPVSPQPARQLMPVSQPVPPREDTSRSLSSLGNALAQEIQARTRAGAPEPAPAPVYDTGQTGRPAARPPSPEQRDGWKLGELLKRASLDEDHGQGGHSEPAAPGPSRSAPVGAQQQAPGTGLDFAAIARALDPGTANDIWGRLGTGQTGIMVRSIYTPEGRAVFDDVVAKFRSDPAVQQDVYRFLQGFEQMLQDAEQQDPSGGMAQQHLTSDYGRGYLLLAHASGRLG